VQVLHSLPKFDHPDLIVGTETSDDAGVFRLRPDLAVVNTVDFFTPIVDEPYVFGQIAGANSLSDVYAMGGEPKTALNIVCFPKGKMDIEVLGEVLKGGADKCKEAGVVIVGGHSIIDEEIKYGMAITGVIRPDRVIRNVGVQAGDALILTKALGTGIITTALKRGKASKESIDAAIDSMITLNKTASTVMRHYPVHACSDITGYGLLGHGLEMASGSSVTLVLESAKLPLLHRARRLAEKGYLTGGCKRNREYLKDKITIEKSIREGVVEVAFDPQTSGGLLIALSQKHAPKFLEELHANGVKSAVQVGYASPLQKPWVRLI
jgi:selenide,water dikinase